MQSHAETAFHHSAGVISDDWPSDGNSSGRSTSSFVLPPASTAKEQGIPDVSFILNKGYSGTRSSAGSAVLEGSAQRVEWKGSTSPGSRYVHGNGCLPRKFYYRPTHDHSANFGQKVLQVTQLDEKTLHLHWSHLPACPPF